LPPDLVSLLNSSKVFCLSCFCGFHTSVVCFPLSLSTHLVSLTLFILLSFHLSAFHFCECLCLLTANTKIQAYFSLLKIFFYLEQHFLSKWLFLFFLRTEFLEYFFLSLLFCVAALASVCFFTLILHFTCQFFYFCDFAIHSLSRHDFCLCC